MKQLRSFNPSVIADELPEMEFCELSKFNEGGTGVFWSTEGGPSPWEMHPDCEELLHVIEGEISVEVLPNDGGPSVITILSSGSMLVVPRGCWHRQKILRKSKEFYLTPGETLHSNTADPRKPANA